MANEFPDTPHNMGKVHRRVEQWRRAHTGRLSIPERLRGAASELPREHGVFPAAKALCLEYGKLKQRVEAVRPPAKGRVTLKGNPAGGVTGFEAKNVWLSRSSDAGALYSSQIGLWHCQRSPRFKLSRSAILQPAFPLL